MIKICTFKKKMKSELVFVFFFFFAPGSCMVSLALVSKLTHLKEPCLVTWKGQVFMSDRREVEPQVLSVILSFAS